MNVDLYAEDAFRCGGRLLANFLFADPIGFGESGDDVADEGGLVALATHGNGGHVGGVGLQDDAVEGYAGWQHFGQVALLEGQHTANAEDEAVELQQLTGFLFVARKAVEHAAGQFSRVPL